MYVCLMYVCTVCINVCMVGLSCPSQGVEILPERWQMVFARDQHHATMGWIVLVLPQIHRYVCMDVCMYKNVYENVVNHICTVCMHKTQGVCMYVCNYEILCVHSYHCMYVCMYVVVLLLS